MEKGIETLLKRIELKIALLPKEGWGGKINSKNGSTPYIPLLRGGDKTYEKIFCNHENGLDQGF